MSVFGYNIGIFTGKSPAMRLTLREIIRHSGVHTMSDSNPTTKLPLKRCLKCGQEKPATNEYFHRDKNRSDGLCPYCKQCVAADGRVYREQNAEAIKERQHKYNVEHKAEISEKNKRDRLANRDEINRRRREKYQPKNSSKTWHRHKPGELTSCTKCGEIKLWTREFFCWTGGRLIQPCRECKRVYRSTHKLEIAEYQTEYRAIHKEESVARTVVRRARKRNLPNVYTFADFRRAKVFFNYRCAYCGRTPKETDYSWVLHQDHYIPLQPAYELTKPNPGTVSWNIVPACQDCNFSKCNNDPHVWIVAHFGQRKGKRIELRIQQFFTKELSRGRL